ncbi:MAG TPA: NADH-quinone oxidoreductase subunit C [Vicinamibacterales bacterium]|nr:NADH-quinone oxidoreductase subunit C [Vicinamibacterales bacterium]
MADAPPDDSKTPASETTPPTASSGVDAGQSVPPAEAAADKPAGSTPAEPVKGEVSRTDAPGAGASAAPTAQPRQEPPAPKPANPAAATTATTSETSSATGQPTAPATPIASKPAAVAAPAAAKPAAAAAKAAPKPAAEHPPKVAAPTGPHEPPPPADLPLPAFITTLQARMPEAVAQVSYFVGDWTLIVPIARVHDVLRYLLTAPDAAFDFCSDVTATDWPPRPERFDLVYCLYSIAHRHRVRVKTRVAENQPVPSVTDLWPAANWLEREVFDMFGVNFTGHPDRRRILMPEDWQGYPQRKDYPLEGPGELLMENPIDWLKLRQTRDEADIE